MRTFEEILKEGNEGRTFREVIDNLTDEQIIESALKYAQQYTKSPKPPEWWAEYKRANPDDKDEYDPIAHFCSRFWKDFCNCMR